MTDLPYQRVNNHAREHVRVPEKSEGIAPSATFWCLSRSYCSYSYVFMLRCFKILTGLVRTKLLQITVNPRINKSGLNTWNYSLLLMKARGKAPVWLILRSPCGPRGGWRPDLTHMAARRRKLGRWEKQAFHLHQLSLRSPIISLSQDSRSTLLICQKFVTSHMAIPRGKGCWELEPCIPGTVHLAENSGPGPEERGANGDVPAGPLPPPPVSVDWGLKHYLFT